MLSLRMATIFSYKQQSQWEGIDHADLRTRTGLGSLYVRIRNLHSCASSCYDKSLGLTRDADIPYEERRIETTEPHPGSRIGQI